MRRRELLLTLVAPLPATAAPPALRTVVIGAEDDWFPYSALVDGRPQGLTVDLVTAAFAAVGITARMEALPYARCMAQTKTGSLVACFNTTRTALIENDYLWTSRPMFEERFLIWGLATETVQRPGGLLVRDLEGQQVAVTRGYEYGTEFDANPRILRVVTGQDEKNFRLLLKGRARYTLSPDANAKLLFQRHPDLAGNFKVVGQLDAFGIYTAFSRTHPLGPTLRASFDDGMKLIHTNGTARAIHDRWKQRLQVP